MAVAVVPARRRSKRGRRALEGRTPSGARTGSRAIGARRARATATATARRRRRTRRTRRRKGRDEGRARTVVDQWHAARRLGATSNEEEVRRRHARARMSRTVTPAMTCRSRHQPHDGGCWPDVRLMHGHVTVFQTGTGRARARAGGCEVLCSVFVCFGFAFGVLCLAFVSFGFSWLVHLLLCLHRRRGSLLGSVLTDHFLFCVLFVLFDHVAARRVSCVGAHVARYRTVPSSWKPIMPAYDAAPKHGLGRAVRLGWFTLLLDVVALVGCVGCVGRVELVLSLCC